MDVKDLHMFLKGCSDHAQASGRESFGGGEVPYDFELDDLFHLYSTVRNSSCVSVLEFGSGWSTLVLALALQENMDSFGFEHSEKVRHPNPFQLLTIDASAHWQTVALARIPDRLKPRLHPVACNVCLTEYLGQVVHFYSSVPSFVPDLIYLDAPDPEQVEGAVSGFEYGPLHSLPMAADVIRLEPHLWPETLIITDGRTANARFLAAHLTRNWQIIHDPFGDRTTFRLEETPFGQVTEQHMTVRLKAARELRTKEAPNST